MREILQVARGGEAVLGLMLASWLIGTAVGALTWRGTARRAAWLLLILPALLLPVLRLWPPTPGGWAPGAALLAAVAAYGPGAFFAALLRRVPARRAVGFEALGAAAAGLGLTLLLLPIIPAFTLLLLTGVTCLAAMRVRLVAVAVIVLAAWPAGRALRLVRAEQLWPGSETVASAETPYGRLLWLRRDTQHSLFVNAELVLTVPDEVQAEAFVNVVLAAHENPRRVLVIGPGAGGVLRECRRHGVERLHMVVRDPRVLELIEDDLPPADREALRATTVEFGDPRRVSGEWDVILVLAPPPLTLAANRFYTREFFANAPLAPGGLIALSLPAAPNVREGQILARNVSVYRAMAPLRVTVLPGTHDILLGGKGAKPSVDPATLAERLRVRGITLRHHAQDFFSEPYALGEVARVVATYARYPKRPPPDVPFAVEENEPETQPPEVLRNDDLHPGAVLHSAAALAREENIPLLRVATSVTLAVPALLILLAVVGLRFGRRATLSVATTGAGSMGLWVVILMVYQARVGALYQDFALLASLYMLGFAAGARVRMSLRVADAALLLLALLVIFMLPFGGRLLYSGLAALTGAAGGVTLANAVAAPGARVTRLYAWDLIGGALAALCFGTFFMPTFGASMACIGVAVLKVVSLARE